MLYFCSEAPKGDITSETKHLLLHRMVINMINDMLRPSFVEICMLQKPGYSAGGRLIETKPNARR